MKKLVLIAALAITGNTFALTTRLAFQVRSSGPDAFACNSGIWHGVPGGGAGYDHAGVDCLGEGCPRNGMRTNTGTFVNENSPNNYAANGVYFPDMMHSHYTVYNPSAVPAWGTTGGLIATGAYVDGLWHTSKGYTFPFSDMQVDLKAASLLSNDTNVIYNHRAYLADGTRVNNVLTSLGFILSSEQYGTHYFVDICNYKPETFCGGECGTSDTETGGHFAYQAFVSGIKSTDSVLKYIDLSGLQVDVKLACDGDLVPGGSKSDINPSTVLTSLLPALNVSGNKCVTRFIFREKKSTSMRLNQLQKACFEVMTEINDPETVLE